LNYDMIVSALLPSPLPLVFSKLDNFLSLMWKGTLRPLIAALKIPFEIV